MERRSTERTDPQGNHHLLMQFYVSTWAGQLASKTVADTRQVEGPRNRGSVHIHLTKHPGQSEHQYKYFYVDIKGHQRIYLEDAGSNAQHAGNKAAKLFGIKWS